jgi:hypothetical protein
MPVRSLHAHSDIRCGRSMSTTATYAMVPPPAGVGLCRRSRTRRRTACVDPSFGLGPLDTWRFRTCGTRPLDGKVQGVVSGRRR